MIIYFHLVLVALALTGLTIPIPAMADRIGVWTPLRESDIEAYRESFKRQGKKYDENFYRQLDRDERTRLEGLRRQLAPVTPYVFGRTYGFEGRILRVIPPVNPSAPKSSDDYYPKIVFEAYGKKGKPISRTPAIINTRHILSNGSEWNFDTVNDFVRLMSNRHILMRVPFGSQKHRQALFAALDPDGTMGLPGERSTETYGGLEEGALMRFGRDGSPWEADMLTVFWNRKAHPNDPIFLFGSFGEHLRPSFASLPSLEFHRYDELTASLIEDYARSLRYPGYEDGFSEIAKATVQIFYSLSLATPDLTSPAYKLQATRYHGIGMSTYHTISRALSDRGKKYKSLPNLPLTTGDVRNAVLDVLEDGPIVPSPEISDQAQVLLPRGLLEVIAKDQSLAAKALTILSRHLAPEPGESAEVTERYELDREQNRKSLYGFLIGAYDENDDMFIATANALAWIGWGNEEEGKDLVNRIFRSILGKPLSQPVINLQRSAIAVLRLVANPQKHTRKDRQEVAFAIADHLEKKISGLRDYHKQGLGGSPSGFNFIELWDAEKK